MVNYDMDEIERKSEQYEIERKREKETSDSAKVISDWVERQADYNPDMVRLEPREHFDWCIKGVVSRQDGHDRGGCNRPLLLQHRRFIHG